MARPRTQDPNRITTALRLPPDVHDRLRDAADERGISVNHLAVMAIQHYLDRLIPIEELQLTRDAGSNAA